MFPGGRSPLLFTPAELVVLNGKLMFSIIKIWTAPYKNTKRTKLLYSDTLYSYIIILEKNKNDMYIISSYLIDEPGYLQNVLKEYNKYKKVS